MKWSSTGQQEHCVNLTPHHHHHFIVLNLVGHNCIPFVIVITTSQQKSATCTEPPKTKQNKTKKNPTPDLSERCTLGEFKPLSNICPLRRFSKLAFNGRRGSLRCLLDVKMMTETVYRDNNQLHPFNLEALAASPLNGKE